MEKKVIDILEELKESGGTIKELHGIINIPLLTPEKLRILLNDMVKIKKISKFVVSKERNEGKYSKYVYCLEKYKKRQEEDEKTYYEYTVSFLYRFLNAFGSRSRGINSNQIDELHLQLGILEDLKKKI